MLSKLKRFGSAQNILGPVKGQGISKFSFCAGTKCFSGLAQKNWIGTKHFGTCRRQDKAYM